MSNMMPSNIDHLARGDEIRKILKRKPFNLSDYDIRDKIGFTSISGTTVMKIHYKTDKVRDILTIPLAGKIEI